MLIFFLSEIWRIWTIFPMENPLYYWSKSHFSGQSFAENSPIKKTLDRSQQNLAIVNQHHFWGVGWDGAVLKKIHQDAKFQHIHTL
jgi:hypothetical protein